MSTYGSRLQAALERKQASRAELAKAIGRTPQAVGQVINGSTKALTAENNSLAAIYLGVNPHWLATGEGDIAPTGQGETSNVTTLPAPRRTVDTLTELQAIVDSLTPLLRDAGLSVLHKWLDGQASAAEAAAVLEQLQQVSVGSAPAAANRAA